MKRFSAIVILLTATSAFAAGQPLTVRVAAIQCPSVMGRTEENLSVITNLIHHAASGGAKIIVLPECAVQGYMDPTTWRSWSKSETGADAVQTVAEPVPGPSTKLLAEVALDLSVYICVGLVETDTNGFFNSQVLLAPNGSIAAHHRKKSLWTPGDSTWCTPGELPVQVVETEYGRLGLMICYDFHDLPPLLAKRQADIVLYSVGWYGPNEKNWFSQMLPRKAVIPYGFDIVVANWTSPTQNHAWPGRGHSCIITGQGKVLAMSESVSGTDIVMADLKIKKRQNKANGE